MTLFAQSPEDMHSTGSGFKDLADEFLAGVKELGSTIDNFLSGGAQGPVADAMRCANDETFQPSGMSLHGALHDTGDGMIQQGGASTECHTGAGSDILNSAINV